MLHRMNIQKLLVLLIVAVMVILPACAQPTPEPTQVPEVTEAPTEEPTEAPTEEPTEEPAPAEETRLILATTTSTADSGLLDYILPDFEAESGVKVDVIAVGTGQALEMGQNGDADVLLVHARAKEDQFMADGHGVRREDVMYNDFIIVGPASDPAGIKGETDVLAAFNKIAETESPFISRGDDSGTHTKELGIWTKAEIEPAGDWYVSAGQGMGAVLTMADEQEAYTLSDRATYLARTLEGTDLEIVVEGDPLLFNPYGVIAVNPDKGEHIQIDLANQFIDWITSVAEQEKIGTFGVEEFGAPLFTPDSALWNEAQGGDADFAITGNVAEEMGWTEDEIKAMETMDVESTNSKGEAETYTGVSLSALLETADPNDDATTVVLVADDGYSTELTLEEVLACEECILSFRNQGGFSSVMPDFAKSAQVKGIVEIQVQ